MIWLLKGFKSASETWNRLQGGYVIDLVCQWDDSKNAVDMNFQGMSDSGRPRNKILARFRRGIRFSDEIR